MTELNPRNNTIERGFHYMRDRYYYDFGKLTPSNGWKQYDTDQDASYFGIWVNIAKLQTFTFCEGDTTIITCPDTEHLKAELDSMAEFYGNPPPAWIGIDTDTGQVTNYYDERPTL